MARSRDEVCDAPVEYYAAKLGLSDKGSIGNPCMHAYVLLGSIRKSSPLSVAVPVFERCKTEYPVHRYA